MEPRFATSVQDGYDRWAAIYDHDANPLPPLEEPAMRRAVGAVENLHVLDLGCGTGRHTAWLAAAGARVSAVDFSQQMLAQARRRVELPQVQFQAHDLHEPLPFAAATFDRVVSGLVLEHLRDPAAFFRESARVLVSCGRLVVSNLHPAMFLRGVQARFTEPGTGEVIQPGSHNHSLSTVLTCALQTGLELRHIEEFAPDAEFAARYPRAQKYVDFPMLVVACWELP